MRASDRDREEVVARLRVGLDDGRLKMEEYLDRMGAAYQAVTYSDLAALHADLPVADSIAKQEAAPLVAAEPVAADPVPVQRGVLADLPTTLKVFWTIWLTAVSINVVVWALVSITSAQLAYPWPLWVAGPFGAALFAVSVGVTSARRGRRPSAQGRPGRKR